MPSLPTQLARSNADLLVDEGPRALDANMGMGNAHVSARALADRTSTAVRTHSLSPNSSLLPPPFPPDSQDIDCSASDGVGKPQLVLCDSLTPPDGTLENCTDNEKPPMVSTQLPPVIPHAGADRASAQTTMNLSNGCCADASRSPTLHEKGNRSKFVDANPKNSKVSKVEGGNRVSQHSPPATVEIDGNTNTVALPQVASKPPPCINQRAGLPRIRTRSNSEPRIAKMPKHRTDDAPLATPPSCTATLDQDDPMRGRASSLASKDGRTTSEVSKAKRIRVAPSTARACITSHAMATIESAKRLSSRPLTPRNSQPQLSAKD